MLYIQIILILLALIDTWLYKKAPFPERTKDVYLLPGGGIMAYFWLKRKT